MSIEDKERKAQQKGSETEEELELHISENLSEKQDEQERPAQEEVMDWEKKAEENYTLDLKALADLENYRRRTRREKEEMIKYAASPLIETLLPVVDNLERALSAGKEAEQAEAFHQGVEMIYRQLMQVLSDSGLSPIESVGHPFDPHVHNAVAQVENDEYDSGIAVRELQKGYRFKDRVFTTCHGSGQHITGQKLNLDWEEELAWEK